MTPGDESTQDVAGTPLDQSDNQGLDTAITGGGHTPSSVSGGGISATLSGSDWASFRIGGGENALLAQVVVDSASLVFAYNGDEEAWKELRQGMDSDDVYVGRPEAGGIAYRVRDQGAFDLDGEPSEVDTKVAVATVEQEPTPTTAPTATPSGGDGGGCTLGFSLVALLLVLIPGFLALRR